MMTTTLIRRPHKMTITKSLPDLPRFSLTQDVPAELLFNYIPKDIFPFVSPVLGQIQVSINDYLRTEYNRFNEETIQAKAECETIKQETLTYAIKAIFALTDWYTENLARLHTWRDNEIEQAGQREAIWQQAAEAAWQENLELRQLLDKVAKAKTVGEVRGLVNEATK